MKASLSLDPSWNEKHQKEIDKKLSLDSIRMNKVAESVRKADLDMKFNKLNPIQRYIKSILGDWTTSVSSSIGRSIMIAIFKDKLH